MSDAVQDLMAGGCFGCGCENEHGLQIKSYWDGEKATCVWTPQPYHVAGPDFMYGGIIASLLDCHCAAAAVSAAYDAEGRAIGSEPRFNYITARLTVDYLKPTPMTGPVELTAWVEKVEGRKSYLRGTLSAQGEERARASALFVRVPHKGA